MVKPKITCLQTIHMKPSADRAIESVLAQEYENYKLVVLDSHQWANKYDDVSRAMRAIWLKYSQYPYTNKIEWHFTGEDEDLKDKACPISWVTNNAIRQGLVQGEYFCTFYDDDIYYPNFFKNMAEYLDNNKDCMAVRCSQKRTYELSDGTVGETPPLMATDFISGENFDCVVDGGQVMMRTKVLKLIDDPWLPEEPEWDICSHSDGIFFNKLGKVIDKMHYIEEILMENRKMPYSTYSPSEGK